MLRQQCVFGTIDEQSANFQQFYVIDGLCGFAFDAGRCRYLQERFLSFSTTQRQPLTLNTMIIIVVTIILTILFFLFFFLLLMKYSSWGGVSPFQELVNAGEIDDVLSMCLQPLR